MLSRRMRHEVTRGATFRSQNVGRNTIPTYLVRGSVFRIVMEGKGIPMIKAVFYNGGTP